jgi:hypothetical protein
MADPTIITSPLSGPFSEGGLTVDVQIYRLEDTKWSLEVIDSEGTSTAWDDQFQTADAQVPTWMFSLTPVRNLAVSSRKRTACIALCGSMDCDRCDVLWGQQRLR